MAGPFYEYYGSKTSQKSIRYRNFKNEHTPEIDFRSLSRTKNLDYYFFMKPKAGAQLAIFCICKLIQRSTAKSRPNVS